MHASAPASDGGLNAYFEVSHRATKVALTEQQFRTATDYIRTALWKPFYTSLESHLAGHFGGIARNYFELALIHGVDIDNTRAIDYVGVARIGVVTKAGPWRWIDIVWCWRSDLGQTANAFHVIRTSEESIYSPENRFFSDKNPSLWPPSLVISGFADFDKDKKLEIVTALLRPVGVVSSKPIVAGGTEVWLRDSAIHAWAPNSINPTRGRWDEVFRTSTHEARIEHLDPKTINIERFGE